MNHDSICSTETRALAYTDVVHSLYTARMNVHNRDVGTSVGLYRPQGSRSD